MPGHDHRSPTIEIDMPPLTVWQAMSLLGMADRGVPMSEERARAALRQVGMKRHEMDEPYPAESMGELFHLINHPDELDKNSEEASRWMINRN